MTRRGVRDDQGNLLLMKHGLLDGIRQISDVLAVNRATDKWPRGGTNRDKEGLIVLIVPLKTQRDPVYPSEDQNVWFRG